MVNKPILLDGSMGQEIVNRGGKSAYGEWSVAALHENPEMVATIHMDYIQAGADVITTNTYSTTRTRLIHVGMEDRFQELVNLAGKLASDARKKAEASHIKIASSLPPLEASYINEFQLTFDDMVAQYSELMTLLDPYVDIYLGETLSTTQESRALLTAAQNRDKPVWVSWTLQDHGPSTLRGDESLEQAIDSIDGFAPDAILINCCTPDSIETALPLLQSTGIQFGAYANGFVEIPKTWESNGDVDQIASRTDLTPSIYSQHMKNWLIAGASIVGGCCDIGPAHIALMREILDEMGE
jgi:S-methylmethionine-dependent homocysteine/selenocysteine methylase